ncbi:MAG TPA: hypothetical protein VE154_00250, partial [Chthoniobacterales bacterium]|nr:hypothetical protein [Chthoniobacterales bacterium]
TSRRTFSRAIGDVLGSQSSLDVRARIARERVPTKDGAQPYREPKHNTGILAQRGPLLLKI